MMWRAANGSARTIMKVTLVTEKGNESWPLMSKEKVAQKLVEKIIKQLGKKS